MSKSIPILALSAVAVACAADERAVTKGSNPVFSPDGSRIAFQRLENNVFKVGVVAVPDRQEARSVQADGGASPPGEPSVAWIEDGPGNAAYPAWTPDGGLVYTAGNDAGTAYEAWKSGSRSGYGLRMWKDGAKRDLTRGRCRDYTPCVSPDGTTVYFATTRGVESESSSFSKAAATRLAALDLAPLREGGDPERAGGRTPCAAIAAPRILLDAPNGNNSGYVQPAVSPDGTLLVWGQMDSFFDTWRICGMRIGESNEGARPPAVRITPSSLAALSPRWHPDGRTVCFTGFRAGDPGWGVWVEDVRTGKARRLATGENPCVSPDGTAIAYDRDGTIFVRPFGPEDEPDALLPDVRDDADRETILKSAHDVVSETAIDVSGDSRFAFGDDKTFFMRAKVRFGGAGGVRQVLTGCYAEHPRAVQLHLADGQIHFVSRDHAGKYFAAKAPLAPKQNGDAHALVAVRTPSRLVLSVDGAPPREVFTGGALPLDTPQSLVFGTGFADGDSIDSVEIGTGWPEELPKTPTREDLFR